jgi:hypothetical protein
MWIVQLLLLSAVASGCGGYYTLTVGDHVTDVGTDAVVVVRLQRNDFFVLNFPAEEALMRFQVADGVERGAYTDALGYAGTVVPVPEKCGRYTLNVNHSDTEGEETSAMAAMFVWGPWRDVVAVEAESLPLADSKDNISARAALKRLSENSNIVYLTRRAVSQHGAIHCQLTNAGYPDGVVLLWQRRRWHVVREGRFKLPRIVVESRLVSQLPELRKKFPKLSVGLCTSPLAGRAFSKAGTDLAARGI